MTAIPFSLLPYLPPEWETTEWETLVEHIVDVEPCCCHTFDVWKGIQGRYKALCTRCEFQTGCESCAKTALSSLKRWEKRSKDKTKSSFYECMECETIQVVDVCSSCHQTNCKGC